MKCAEADQKKKKKVGRIRGRNEPRKVKVNLLVTLSDQQSYIQIYCILDQYLHQLHNMLVELFGKLTDFMVLGGTIFLSRWPAWLIRDKRSMHSVIGSLPFYRPPQQNGIVSPFHDKPVQEQSPLRDTNVNFGSLGRKTIYSYLQFTELWKIMLQLVSAAQSSIFFHGKVH